nr:peroxisomal fatty acid beta-oxidation multifunctional protein aim1 [Quercus suber]
MSEEGKKLGLIDSLVASEELLKVAWQWALDMANMRKPLVHSLHRTDKIGSLSEARNLINIARQQARKTAPNMPQHQVCLDTIEVGIVQGGYSGVLQEKKVFNDVVSSDTSKGLVHAFFSQRATSKVPNVTDVGLKPRHVNKVAVIGGGSQLRISSEGIKISRSPAHVMPLLEIVRTEKTSAQVILDIMTVGKIIKKVPVVVGNCAGFAVNRTFFPYSQGAHLLVNLGVDVFRIDRAISSFGLPMGPFQAGAGVGRLKLQVTASWLQDVAGYGVAMAAGKVIANAFSDHSFTSPLVELLLKNGRNGKNNEKGYYIFERGASRNLTRPIILPQVVIGPLVLLLIFAFLPISVTEQEIVEMIPRKHGCGYRAAAPASDSS